jgi:hypothetical protein
MKAAYSIAVSVSLCFAGCSSPGSQYASAHPELSKAHREILRTGKMPGGSPVEGMTKEQVRLALGPPSRMNGGGDVWVYVRERSPDMGPGQGAGGPGGNDPHAGNGPPGRPPMVNELTMVFFQKDRAMYTQISRERR